MMDTGHRIDVIEDDANFGRDSTARLTGEHLDPLACDIVSTPNDNLAGVFEAADAAKQHGDRRSKLIALAVGGKQNGP
jgi:hypothetical protein